MKIAVYSIAKNEEQFVERCVKSAAAADVFVIADTGSTDKTVEAGRDAGAVVHSVAVRPWRFDAARNVSLGLVPADVDVCVCIDIDEVLESGWREEIEQCWEPRTTRMRYLFDWGSGVRFQSDKIHARAGYLWRHPCHELLLPYGDMHEVWAGTDKLLITHLPDPTKSRGQYLELLRLGVKEDPTSHRSSFYLAREYTFYAMWDEALAELTRYLAMPAATWAPERAFAMRLLGRTYEALGQPVPAMQWYRRGVAEEPARREPWIALAEACYRRALWPECLSAALSGLAITWGRDAWPNEPAAWGWKAHDLAAIAAYNMKLYALALEHGQLAVLQAPEDLRLQANVRYYQQAVLG